MIAPLVLFLISAAGLALAWLMPGMQALVLVAGPSALASFLLLLQGAWQRRRARRHRDWILIDGSNVMYWKDNTPSMETLHDVVGDLRRRGLTPAVVFDANAGYLLENRYMGDADFARALNLPAAQVLVVPRGSPADPYLLAAARDHGARIVTNDRFRDWAKDHPEIAQDGYLVPGRYRGDALQLALDPVKV